MLEPVCFGSSATEVFGFPGYGAGSLGDWCTEHPGGGGRRRIPEQRKMYVELEESEKERADLRELIWIYNLSQETHVR